MSIEMIEIEEFNQGTQIKVIGVGGGGGNAVGHMIDCGVQGVEFICANTDAQALSRGSAHKTIQLGNSGLGAGSKPDKGRDAAELAVDDIRSAIAGAHMLFITAGMGGGTGTGAAPVIARVAKEMGILTVGVVTKPFDFEGGRRMTNADLGLAELEANVDSLIVVLNEKLLEVLGDDVTQDEAFAHANDVLKNAVGGIAEIINVPGHVNVDFEDVRTVMGEPGKAMMGTAKANGPDRARIAAEQAVACPLLEGIDLSGAKGVLVLITAAKGSLKLSESKLAMNTIRAYASPDAHVIYGTAYDDELGDDIRVTVVATGLSRQGVRRHAPPLQVLRTGTDNVPFNLPTLNSVAGASSAPGSMGHAQPDYGGMSVPSVWRTNRTQAAAKVDALASGGMDDFEIPAFLRKQAD
ncbi:MAG: cell division protein FtsZ [Polaromonas sp. 39-63-203]|jgi:cell division protein FtsZ|uniref:cell division protein FtsZ n=1 Tax=Polaromonas sp. TaxID=1869339 RepID=UPI000BD32963|nr:cell division protein FtsZ [Polaromonas sp.]OYY53243.1 MAG: cell division protein FtsZ [Polaromonas sp. 35-63-240]OYY99592.1 MAG: cell division protein FtsZ [Polaromonas sp. 28-63-22]OYZ84393.1 MAG: cell division protein FtsZ [Polaromonas sp. 24-62-144]OZA99912.1 MAG: cell division protein FtsZ [Polaromonas sp. 39-63-203]HQS31257.1 cell division protein FtsZ [Polaromonas sp.]